MEKITDEQIQALTLKEANKLKESLESHIAGLKEAEQAEAIEQAHKILASVGLTISDLKPSKKTRKSSPVVAKYQHPTDENLKWSGRGRQKIWVTEWLEQNPGKKVDDLEIKYNIPF
jgi:DNA-binding protein H-NS